MAFIHKKMPLKKNLKYPVFMLFLQHNKIYIKIVFICVNNQKKNVIDQVSFFNQLTVFLLLLLFHSKSKTMEAITTVNKM